MKTVSPHPNLIEYIGDCVATVGDVQTFYILMELCSVQLSQIISDRNSNPGSESEVLNIFSQVNGSANLLAGLKPCLSRFAVVSSDCTAIRHCPLHIGPDQTIYIHHPLQESC